MLTKICYSSDCESRWLEEVEVLDELMIDNILSVGVLRQGSDSGVCVRWEQIKQRTSRN